MAYTIIVDGPSRSVDVNGYTRLFDQTSTCQFLRTDKAPSFEVHIVQKSQSPGAIDPFGADVPNSTCRNHHSAASSTIDTQHGAARHRPEPRERSHP